MKVFPYSAALCLVAIFGLAGCGGFSESSSLLADARLTTGRLGTILAATLFVVFGSVCWIMLLRRSVARQTRILLEKTRELEKANQIAHDALDRFLEAEGVERDRKTILELVVKDAPLEGIMQAICEAAARHLKIGGCSIQLNLADGSRMARSANISESIAAVLSCINIEGFGETRAFSPIEGLSDGSVWNATLPLLRESQLSYYCALPISRNRRTAGFLVGFSAQQSSAKLDLESWSGIASLAVERRGFFEQLSHRAQHDNLTGLVNRISLYERLDIELAQTAHEGAGLSLIYLDLDGFKNINDDYGHDAGDAVLREVARRIRGSIRRTDIAARLGGDEFVVLLPGVNSREESVQVGKLILDALSRPIVFGELALETGSSLGVAVYPMDGTDAEVLLKFADQDMYRQKGLRKAPPQNQRVFV